MIAAFHLHDIAGIALGWLVIAVSFCVVWKLLKDTDYPDAP